MDVVIIIPARAASTRLPGKPLADIAGDPMIVHVWRRAVEAALGPVFVACDHPDVRRVIVAAGGSAVMTESDAPSGSDRVKAALDTRRLCGVRSSTATSCAPARQ